MKKIILSLLSVCVAIIAICQDVDFDKNTGLVKVDGKASFYLVKKNKNFLTYDLSLQNLNNEELAFLKSQEVADLPWDERGNKVGTFLKMTFINSTNTVNVFPDGFSGIKWVAKHLAKAKLIVDNAIDPKAERAFVLSYNGKLYREPVSPVNVIINNPSNSTNNSSMPAQIAVRENRIYNNDEVVGTFKKMVDANNILTVTIYKKDDSKIAVATHNENKEDEDWAITTNGKTNQILYNKQTPLEKLFKYFVDKGLL